MHSRKICLMSVLLLSAAACSRTDSDSLPVPVCIKAANMLQTKGYVVSSQMADTPPEYLHSECTPDSRVIHVSCQALGTDGDSAPYFRNEPFTESSSGVWSCRKGIYRPFGCTLNFMAYSSSVGLSSEDVSFDPFDVSEEMTLTISRAHTQDDVLFGCALGATADTVGMVFRHSQAWIGLRICSTGDMSDRMTLVKVSLDDIYTDGALTVTHPYGYAQAEWDFRLSTSAVTDVDDTLGVFGSRLTEVPCYLDMLLPEQKRTSIFLYYTYTQYPDVVFECDLPLDGGRGTWEMGRKYIYDIELGSNEIKVRPSVEDWDVINTDTPLAPYGPGGNAYTEEFREEDGTW